MLKIHLNILSKDYSTTKKLSLDVLNDLGKMATLNQFQNLISEWAYQECGINFSQSWNLDVINHRRCYIFKDKVNEENEFSLDKPTSNGKIRCNCAYFEIFGIPCLYLFSLAREFPEKVDLLKCFRARWMKTSSFKTFEDTELIENIDKYFLKEDESSNFFLGLCKFYSRFFRRKFSK